MKNTRQLNPCERSTIRFRLPEVTEDELDDAIAWSDETVAQELEDEGWEVEADTIVEVEIGYGCFHALFFQGLIQGCTLV